MWWMLLAIVFIIGTIMWLTDVKSWQAFNNIKLRRNRIIWVLAIPFFLVFVEVFPDIFDRMGKSPSALETLQNQMYEEYINKGNSYLAEGLFREAILSYGQVTDVKVSQDLYCIAFEYQGAAFNAWGKDLAQRGQNDSARKATNSAIVCYDRAIHMNHSSGTAWFFRSCILNKMDRIQEAIASYDSAKKYGVDSFTVMRADFQSRIRTNSGNNGSLR
jgi:tetratricopeptide (TPR) repeat protein